MAKMLSKEFFNRPADVVARELIGCDLCIQNVNGGKGAMRYSIKETEAYIGPHDLACHASKGRTRRTEVLYKEAGTIYVYLIYGMYDMLNIVTGEKEYPAAVLIRTVGDWDGPGKLTRALGVTREQNGQPLGRKTGLWIEKPQCKLSGDIVSTPRIGIAYAKEWADKDLRFVLHTTVG